MNSGNKTLTGGGGLDGANHNAAGPGLIDECQELSGCRTGECKVTLSYKLPAEYVFHAVRLRDKSDYELNDFYHNCLQKVRAFNVKAIVF